MAQTKKQQITTSARSGPMRMALGCVLIAIGFGWGLGLLVNTASVFSVLQFLRDTAHGLGGTLCTLLPVFALWGGAMLCASARRKVSVRAYFIALVMYVILLSILTLWSSVSGQNLMTFVANCNKSWLGMQEHTSYGAYLVGAYNLRAFNGGMLAGGGLLGMLLAYPLYCTYFGTAGSAFILCAVELLLLLWLLRLNPFEMWKNVNVRRDARMQGQEEVDEEEYAPQPQPQRVQMHVEQLIPQQQVTYSRGTSVQSDVQESFLVPEQQRYEEYREPTPQDRGFVPVETGVLYEEHIPVGDDYKPAEAPKKRTTRRSARHAEVPVQQTEEKPAVQEETVPWYSDEEMQAQPKAEKAYEAPETQQQSFEAPRVKASPVQAAEPERKPVVRAGSHATGEIKQVYTDPAVDLGSRRIAINPRNEEAPRMDPFAEKHTREAMRAVSETYSAPPLTLLKDPQRQLTDTTAEDNERAALLEHTLASFNIDAKVSYVVHGPAITRFALKLADGVNVNRLNNISNNLAMTMQAVGLRIEIPIPGTSLVGIEVPNKKVSMVTFKEVLDSPAMQQNPSPTAVAMGKDITGTPIICDLSDMPHLLIAGATGSGKSVCINSIIMSILYRATPQQVRMLMIDPKLVELQPYNGIPHLLTEVVSDPKKAAAALDWVVQEMGDRYRRFQQTGVRNIAGYNGKMKNEADKMPDIVVIIDEFSDLMVQCRKQVEESIQRLAALARAAGIYMIVATQRPSVDVITGVIKANIPSRIAFAVANNVDSRTIIDSNGAEKLLGKGDMLYFPRSEFRPLRVQGCFVSDNEVSAITDFIKDNNDATYDSRVDEHMERAAREEAEASAAAAHPNDPEYQTNTENELLQRAIEMAVESGQMSISMLRRRLGLGHSRAGKLIDKMASLGIVSQDEGPKPRRTLITREDYIKMQAQILDE